MLTALDGLTFGMFAFIGLGVGAMMGFVTYRAQRAWYGDDHDSALIKGCIVGLLTAIPGPIAWGVALPGGLVGLFRRRK